MKVLFCGRSFPDARQRVAALLDASGHEFINCDADDVMSHLDGVDVIIPTIARIGADIMDSGKFGFIQQLGVGLDTVDIESATRCGVWVARVPSSKSGNAASVAELAVYLMIGLSRKQAEMHDVFRSRRVGQPLGMALIGRAACIVGLGNIGRELAARLRVFGMSVTAVTDGPGQDIPGLTGVGREYPLAEIKEAVAGADYVVLCINYHPGLHNLVSRDLISCMKPGAFLVNVARGGLVNHDDLYAALAQGLLSGAGLDVFCEEPVDPDHPLFSQNVIATPHIGGVTDASNAGNAAVCVENINRYARGEEPLYAANRPVFRRHI